ncbi:MAG: hypothetical protein V3S69_01885 [Dehalococcoidales bacterium]
MSGETTVEPGYLYNEITGEVNNLNKLNRLGNPTVRVNSGAIGTDELADGSVTSDKLDEDIIAQINADATIGDGSITTSKLASGSVTYVKLNADVLAKMVERDTPTSTIGNFLRYVNTAGVTEEVHPADIFGPKAIASGKLEETGSGTSGTLTVSHGIALADSYKVIVRLHSLCANGGSGNSNFPCHGTAVFKKTSGGTWSNSGSYALANGTAAGDVDNGASSGTTLTLPTLSGSTVSFQQTITIKDNEVDVVNTVGSDTGFQVTASVEVA